VSCLRVFPIFENQFLNQTTSLASPVPFEISNTDASHRWTLVPDAEGHMHLVDLNPVDTPIEPSFNAEADIVFLLYTRQNPTVGQRLILGDLELIRNSNFNPSHPTRFTIHGWQGSINSTVNRNSAAQYFILGNFNVRNS
jgi:pancreatic triacylglycerol lipase